MEGFDYTKEEDVVVCLPIEKDYFRSRCQNIITIELDKMSECSYMNDAYDIFHHYVLCDRIGFEEKLLSIRVPGGSVGYIQFDENNIITDCHVDTDYVIEHYWRQVNKHLKKYIGRQLVIRDESKKENE